MMNYKAIEKLLTGETEKESKVIRPEVFKDQTAYNTVMNNCQRIGGKRFCCIPLELLEIDEDYQRVYCINMDAICDEHGWQWEDFYYDIEIKF